VAGHRIKLCLNYLCFLGEQSKGLQAAGKIILVNLWRRRFFFIVYTHIFLGKKEALLYKKILRYFLQFWSAQVPRDKNETM